MPTNDENFFQEKEIPVIYVDTFRIGYDAYKFVLELGSLLPDGVELKVQTRAIMAPEIVIKLIKTLAPADNEYRNTFLFP